MIGMLGIMGCAVLGVAIAGLVVAIAGAVAGGVTASESKKQQQVYIDKQEKIARANAAVKANQARKMAVATMKQNAAGLLLSHRNTEKMDDEKQKIAVKSARDQAYLDRNASATAYVIRGRFNGIPSA